MPVFRTGTPIKPVKTERTHEENQERAYIAASRRSDRSLEARVESARRASEIHKKRTGRSLRVREEDVINEEMYEEEDDDLPMQYRRINALNPHLSYAFAERLNNYVNGQIGVRSALQQAIAQSNQYQQNQQMLNLRMQQNGCFANPAPSPAMSGQPQPPWAMNNAPAFQPNFHTRSLSYSTPQDFSGHQRPQSQSAPNSAVDAPRMSLPTQNTAMPGTPSMNGLYQQNMSRPAASPTTFNAAKSTSSPQQVPSPPQSVSTPVQHDPALSPHLMRRPSPNGMETSMAPLTTKLPNETLQILEGTRGFGQGYFHLQQPPVRPKYSYNPNPKSKSSPGSAGEKPNPFEGLNQTLSPSALHNNAAMPPYQEPSASVCAPTNLDFLDMDNFGSLPLFDGQNTGFDFGGDAGAANRSGFCTPADPDAFGEFFNFQATPECDT